MDAITVTLTRAEHATVLAALRYWQREGLLSGGHERDIAEEHGEALKAEAIGELCERINTAPDVIRIGVYVEGGNVTDVTCDNPAAATGIKVVRVDYDTEDGDPACMTTVPQDSAEDTDAYVCIYDFRASEEPDAKLAETERRKVEG